MTCRGTVPGFGLQSAHERVVRACADTAEGKRRHHGTHGHVGSKYGLPGSAIEEGMDVLGRKANRSVRSARSLSALSLWRRPSPGCAWRVANNMTSVIAVWNVHSMHFDMALLKHLYANR
jgi:hypothetical protein